MFLPVTEGDPFLRRLQSLTRPGGALVILDKVQIPSGCVGSAFSRLILLQKVCRGCETEGHHQKLSLAGYQSSLDPRMLPKSVRTFFRSASSWVGLSRCPRADVFLHRMTPKCLKILQVSYPSMMQNLAPIREGSRINAYIIFVTDGSTLWQCWRMNNPEGLSKSLGIWSPFLPQSRGVSGRNFAGPLRSHDASDRWPPTFRFGVEMSQVSPPQSFGIGMPTSEHTSCLKRSSGNALTCSRASFGSLRAKSTFEKIPMDSGQTLQSSRHLIEPKLPGAVIKSPITNGEAMMASGVISRM